ncbi:hypothetical protein A2886_00770 [candidate division WWE3 bacterium RIFCSPHIGHO2_01_FULL_42_13]|uniref:Glycosyl transferase family 1 domain-containing protein n=1 Tax=candidate division WWE3 bacterium RIFCSPHIGHO2_01_FULL_42_13 TaxID=1802617 RepID=A0A1F4USK9_UNCKA|nr:MAG: hypothetical protein A2886_00770 [candidate division WWE3 bacterium RIFCSPHIGHO2_01_FULL_42_13]
MRVALVHDDLIQFGGAENLLLALHEIWPEAPIYTAVASRKWKKICKDKKIDLRTSFMQNLPFSVQLNRYYAPFLIHPLAFESFDFSGFDLVISSSARYAHGIITKPETLHICYMNSPGRMFWEPSRYFEDETYGLLKPFKFLARPFLSLPLSYLREWDYIAAQRPDYFIANSTSARERIKKYYGREAEVIYPFVDYEKFSRHEFVLGDYYIVLTRLAYWKKVDLAIEACNKLKLNLKIISEGPALAYLKKIAGPTIEFLGYVDDEKRNIILSGVRALINTQEEDFGIVPLEAMASGKPVIAFGKGGAVETVIPGKTGEFFYEQSSDALISLLTAFHPEKYDPEMCREQAKRFEKSVFTAKIKETVSELWLQRKQKLQSA